MSLVSNLSSFNTLGITLVLVVLYGQARAIPYEAIGVLHSQLLNDWYQELSGDGWTRDDARMDPVPYWEECVRHPWRNMHLNQLRDTCLRPINGDLIDPLLESTKTKNNLYRLPLQRGSSQALRLRKWSRSF